MPAKQLMYSDKAREEMLVGVRKLARTVKATLGPVGHNVLLQKSWGAPRVIAEETGTNQLSNHGLVQLDDGSSAIEFSPRCCRNAGAVTYRIGRPGPSVLPAS